MAFIFHNGKNDLTEKIERELADDNTKLFVVGGDGTFLKALAHFSYGEIPLVFGFKNGTVNFLLPFNISLLPEVYREIKTKIFKSVERSRLHLTSHKRLFVNELVIRSSEFRLNTFEIEVNGSSFSLKGSEIVVATQTGSTGYSASLGGPLLLTNSVIINCSAPNRCNFKSIVLPASAKIRITAERCMGYLDGKAVEGETFEIEEGDNFKMAIPDDYDSGKLIENIFFNL